MTRPKPERVQSVASRFDVVSIAAALVGCPLSYGVIRTPQSFTSEFVTKYFLEESRGQKVILAPPSALCSLPFLTNPERFACATLRKRGKIVSAV